MEIEIKIKKKVVKGEGMIPFPNLDQDLEVMIIRKMKKIKIS